MSPEVPPLGNEIHVWLARLGRNVYRAERATNTLSSEEQERAERFSSPADRSRFMRTRSLLRRLLSAYTGLEPRSIAIAYGPEGKPHLDGPATGPQFSVSHAGNFALLAFSATVGVGADLERLRPVPVLALADRYFSGPEATELHHCTERRRLARFFELWTYREAYAKAHGEGLWPALAELRAATYRPWEEGGHGDWQVRRHPAPRGYRAAVAWEGDDRHVFALSVDALTRDE